MENKPGRRSEPNDGLKRHGVERGMEKEDQMKSVERGEENFSSTDSTSAAERNRNSIKLDSNPKRTDENTSLCIPGKVPKLEFKYDAEAERKSICMDKIIDLMNNAEDEYKPRENVERVETDEAPINLKELTDQIGDVLDHIHLEKKQAMCRMMGKEEVKGLLPAEVLGRMITEGTDANADGEEGKVQNKEKYRAADEYLRKYEREARRKKNAQEVTQMSANGADHSKPNNTGEAQGETNGRNGNGTSEALLTKKTKKKGRLEKEDLTLGKEYLAKLAAKDDLPDTDETDTETSETDSESDSSSTPCRETESDFTQARNRQKSQPRRRTNSYRRQLSKNGRNVPSEGHMYADDEASETPGNGPAYPNLEWTPVERTDSKRQNQSQREEKPDKTDGKYWYFDDETGTFACDENGKDNGARSKRGTGSYQNNNVHCEDNSKGTKEKRNALSYDDYKTRKEDTYPYQATFDDTRRKRYSAEDQYCVDNYDDEDYSEDNETLNKDKYDDAGNKDTNPYLAMLDHTRRNPTAQFLVDDYDEDDDEDITIKYRGYEYKVSQRSKAPGSCGSSGSSNSGGSKREYPQYPTDFHYPAYQPPNVPYASESVDQTFPFPPAAHSGPFPPYFGRFASHPTTRPPFRPTATNHQRVHSTNLAPDPIHGRSVSGHRDYRYEWYLYHRYAHHQSQCAYYAGLYQQTMNARKMADIQRHQQNYIKHMAKHAAEKW